MEPAATTRWGLRNWGIWVLLGLFFFSLYLALCRIYQVDEAQNLYTARILASHWEQKYFLTIEIWHLWPLAWLAARVPESVALLHGARLFMLAVFWVNIFLIALNCGLRWNSKKFLWVLLGAATLAPLWDYGFEVRHENLLLLCFLLYLRSFRLEGGHSRTASLLLGALAALMQFITFKAFVYWLPMAALFLAFPPKPWGLSRIRTFMFGLLGFLALAILALGLMRMSGTLPFFLRGFSVGLDLSGNASVRFLPWDTLTRLLTQTPWLLGVAVAAGIHTIGSVRENWREHCTWEVGFPESFLVLIALLALLVNPAPHPYNLCLLVPFAYILGIRWISANQPSLGSGTPLLFLWVGLVVFTHLFPFLKTTLRHLERPNDRQERLVGLAESLTDPAKDRVYDAAGLVSSRESIGHQWYLHTLILERIRQGKLPSVRQMLEDKPASVLIPNYRFSWLTKEDISFINANYLALANDFLVLGRVVQEPRLDFDCIHPGRYYIASNAQGSGPVPSSLTLDGLPIQVPSVQLLSQGRHTFTAGNNAGILVGWVGPKLEKLPTMERGDANTYFFNWY